MFGFSDNNDQAGGDAADPTTVASNNSLEHHEQTTPLVASAPAVDDSAVASSDYIMTDVTPPSISSIAPDTSNTSSVPVVHPPAQSDATDTTNTDEVSSLLTLKQSALQELSPLVNHLDQTPEEKFRTTMMLIQASDNQALLRDAFQAAKGISDEKARAQALLDIVNEINYFTQQDENNE